MKKYDAVVIGAGNGGLVAAIRLLQGGAKTLLVEKHNIPGGFATSFRRGRFEFEASLHELNDFGTPDNAGDVRVLFDQLGVTDKIEWLQIPEAYRVISREEKIDATLPFGKQAFIDKMESYVPGSRKSMEKFFELAEEPNAQQERSFVIEATQLLYPYLRSAVTNLTAQAYIAPLNLPVISGPIFPEDKDVYAFAPGNVN